MATPPSPLPDEQHEQATATPNEVDDIAANLVQFVLPGTQELILFCVFTSKKIPIFLFTFSYILLFIWTAVLETDRNLAAVRVAQTQLNEQLAELLTSMLCLPPLFAKLDVVELEVFNKACYPAPIDPYNEKLASIKTRMTALNSNLGLVADRLDRMHTAVRLARDGWLLRSDLVPIFLRLCATLLGKR
jgi:hypothetical protein